jgi:hypothetical protein
MKARAAVVVALTSAVYVAGVNPDAERNPAFLRAAELLQRTDPGVAPRVRFEWEQIPGAHTYVLSGRWADGQSWAIRSSEYRVTARNATRWGREVVTFDVSLPPGAHSWRVVALFGNPETGDFASPAQVSFALREEVR